MYVGCSMRGAGRALDTNHHVLGRNVLPDDVIEVEFFPGIDVNALYAQEQRQIRALRPERNAVGTTNVTEIRRLPAARRTRPPKKSMYERAREARKGRSMQDLLAHLS